MKRRIKINGLFLFILTIIFLSFHKFFSGHWRYKLLDEILDIIGLSFICLGFLLRISGRGYKSEKSKEGHHLVLDGPYGLVRNPMYLGILMIGIGMILFLWKWWLIFIFLFLFFFRFFPQIRQEENILSSHFGIDYKSYSQRVPRLLPNISFLFKEDIRKLLPLKYKWIKKETWTVIAVLAITFIIELHEDVSHYGKLEYIKETILLLNIILYFIIFTLFLSKQKEAG